MSPTHLPTDVLASNTLLSQDIESRFWEIKHHGRGFVLVQGMQHVLDSPSTITGVCIRKSQRYSSVCPAQEFDIANLDVLLIELATSPA